jgi:nitrogen-specific signal transduction histidine kinase
MNDFSREREELASVEGFLDLFKKHITCIEGIENFVLIGDKTLEVNESEINFEIQCRCIGLGENCELEFLFNDVTRTKIIEEKNAEFKYKCIFLSKVAHEFKNPLVCITELITQISEDLEAIELKKADKIRIDNKFQNIKSFSNFLVILVKDLNVFSEKQLGRTSSIEKKEVNLDEVINFCKRVTESLLMRNNKSQNVKFIVKKKNCPKNFITDEWSLKQVLINLLSNSVKFTLNGKICLKISKEDGIVNSETKSFLKFQVKDTGAGISEEEQIQLFQPFTKLKNKNNELGSGLGLLIAKDVVEKLGGDKIYFSSKIEEGSRFWFFLSLEEESIKSNIKSSKLSLDESNSESGQTIKIDSFGFDVLNKDFIFENSNQGEISNLEHEVEEINFKCKSLSKGNLDTMKEQVSSVLFFNFSLKIKKIFSKTLLTSNFY